MHNTKHTVFIYTGRIISMAMIWWLDYKVQCITLCISLLILSEAISLKCIVAKITSYVQSCLLKCFIVYLLLYYII